MTAAEPFPTEWTPEVARKLAEPFAAAQIGKLPRGGDNVARDQWTWCNDCKQKAAPRHLHVDYINHAVVTDRLNSIVGPHNWSWSLLTVERDQGGKLLAVVGEMAVLGHTKGPETGTPAPTQKDYGDQLKSAISDYICRAAMRFGVALDLWAKQQLESAAAEEHKPTAAAKKSEPDGTGERDGGLDAEHPVAGVPSQGEAFGNAPPRSASGSDAPRFSGPGAARAWLRGQPEEFRTEIEQLVGEATSASLADLNDAIETAWRKTQQAA